MRFAKIVFFAAGLWGLAIVTPLYLMIDVVGRQYPPAVTHPDFYYGFVGVTLAWQVAFLLISSDPIRFRPIMLVAIVEKLGYVVTLTTLYMRGQVQLGQFAIVSPDFLLGLFFVAAFIKTPRDLRASRTSVF
jgi:hypothetical protein